MDPTYAHNAIHTSFIKEVISSNLVSARNLLWTGDFMMVVEITMHLVLQHLDGFRYIHFMWLF